MKREKEDFEFEDNEEEVILKEEKKEEEKFIPVVEKNVIPLFKKIYTVELISRNFIVLTNKDGAISISREGREGLKKGDIIEL